MWKTKTLRVFDAIAEVLRTEGVETIVGFPSSPLFDSAASVGIRPIICRQERVGVGIADGLMALRTFSDLDPRYCIHRD
ncbi:MAG: thiamine pyrophosphate-binding protein [Candidatus Bathyarchaeia archaeon]